MSETKNLTAFSAIGSLSVDCTAMASFLVDLPRGARARLRTAQPGMALVLAEILANQASIGESAGVTNLDYSTLVTLNDRIDMIDAELPALKKLTELLVETRAHLEDQRQRHIAAIATAVEARAKIQRSPDLLARYERTREYYSAPGVKAWKTRRRNEQESTDEPIPGADDPVFLGTQNADQDTLS